MLKKISEFISEMKSKSEKRRLQEEEMKRKTEEAIKMGQLQIAWYKTKDEKIFEELLSEYEKYKSLYKD